MQVSSLGEEGVVVVVGDVEEEEDESGGVTVDASVVAGEKDGGSASDAGEEEDGVVVVEEEAETVGETDVAVVRAIRAPPNEGLDGGRAPCRCCNRKRSSVLLEWEIQWYGWENRSYEWENQQRCRAAGTIENGDRDQRYDNIEVSLNNKNERTEFRRSPTLPRRNVRFHNNRGGGSKNIDVYDMCNDDDMRTIWIGTRTSTACTTAPAIEAVADRGTSSRPRCLRSHREVEEASPPPRTRSRQRTAHPRRRSWTPPTSASPP